MILSADEMIFYKYICLFKCALPLKAKWSSNIGHIINQSACFTGVCLKTLTAGSTKILSQKPRGMVMVELYEVYIMPAKNLHNKLSKSLKSLMLSVHNNLLQTHYNW